MRKYIALLLLTAASAALAYYLQPARSQAIGQARVKTINGYYVYINSRPVKDYIYIKSCSISGDTCQGDIKQRLALFLAYLKDSIPAANGVIVQSLDFDTLHVIQVK